MKSLTLELKLLPHQLEELDKLEAEKLGGKDTDLLGSTLHYVSQKRLFLKKFIQDNSIIAGFGYIFMKEDRIYQYVNTEHILKYIKENYESIADINWSGLFDNRSSIQSSSIKLNLGKDQIKDVHPFDNESFWKYATNIIKGINLEFIKSYVDKINFSHDETTMVCFNVREYYHIPSNLSLSQSKSLHWSSELINEFKAKWNWKQLTANSSIKWEVGLINSFSNELDFSVLSSRVDLDWTETLLEQYESRWDWVELSANPSLPWNYELLKKFEGMWCWKSNSSSLEYLKSKSHLHLKPKSISHNSGIRWTNSLCEFIDKVDIWTIAANCHLSSLFISAVPEMLNETRYIYSIWRRNSDWPLEEEEVTYSGWELIRMNSTLFYNNL